MRIEEELVLVGIDNSMIIENEKFYKLNVLNIKDGNYYIAKSGQIYSDVRHRMMKHTLDKNGYHCIHLSLNGNQTKIFRVAALVLHTFVGPPPSDMLDPTTQHIDGNIDNNDISNLMWMERNENSSKRPTDYNGENNPSSKLTEKEVLEIANLLHLKQHSLQEISDKYNVDKTTVANIKYKKTWQKLLKNVEFDAPKPRNKNAENQKRQMVFELFRRGYTAAQLLKMGYNCSSVYRWRDKFWVQEGIKDVRTHG